MEERHERLPVAFEKGDERRRRDNVGALVWSGAAVAEIARGSAAEELVAHDEARIAVVEHEGSVGKRAQRFRAPRAEPLAVELLVDRVGALLPGMDLRPDRGEAVVVGAAAQRARTVSGR